jgi:predicted ATPase/DNA-binding NarL/FixJ family response regulator
MSELAGHAGSSAAPVVVDLAPIDDANDVLGAIAASLGVSGTDTADLEDAVLRALHPGPSLLVLDNFEQVLPAGELVDRLLGGLTGVDVLVTSRIPLAIAGEHVIRVEPLPTPSRAEDLEAADAGRLLITRARERGGLRRTEAGDSDALVAICQRLDGIPLALELAAAWTGVLSPRAIVRRLDDRRLRLAGPEGHRHATLERVVESTLELLDPADRQVFDRLSIFVAPFDEEGARAIADVDDVLPVIRRLEAIALVQPLVDPDGEPRFRILDTIRHVAAGRLADDRDRDTLERRFVGHAAAAAQRAADALRDVRPGGALTWMTAEQPNLRAALAIAMRRGEANRSVQLAMTLATYGIRAGNVRESLDRLRHAMQLGPVDPAIRSEALCAIVNLSVAVQEKDDLTGMCREAIALARAAGDARREARALIALGSYGPRAEAEEILAEAVEFTARIGYTWATLAALDNLATAKAEAGQWKAALDLVERSAGIAAEAGDTEGIGFTLTTMADLTAKLGRPEEAYALAIRATEANRETWPQGQVLAWSLATRATCEVLTGRRAAAAATLGEACRIARAAESNAAVGSVLETAVCVLAGAEPELAARCAGFLQVDRAAREPHRPESPITAAELARARSALGDREFTTQRDAGRASVGWTLLGEVDAAAAKLRRAETRVAAEYGRLTGREMEVLELLGRGSTDPEIGSALGMSAKTASVHVANIKSKLGVETRIDAALRAREIAAATHPSRPS